MLQLANHTPFKCLLSLFPNEAGVDCAYGAVKATFELGSKGVPLAKDQAGLVLADEYWGEPNVSSLKYAAEVCLTKPTTDVILSGHAYSRGGRATVTNVRLKVGGMEKTIRVFGNRIWQSGPAGLCISSPEPFDKMPLRYELAFGGTDRKPEDPQKIDSEPRNPIGRGLVPSKSKTPRNGIPLPNLEDPRQLIASPKDRPPPACFAPICAHWQPRLAFAGTYDETWQKQRAPFLPADFNSRFFQVAPPDLIAPSFLRGGEAVEIDGASPDGPVRLRLPLCTVEMTFHLDGKACTPPAHLDTVGLEPDQRRFWLIWRACQVVDKKTHRLRELEVRCRELTAGGGKS